jgi:hypothetical protein
VDGQVVEGQGDDRGSVAGPIASMDGAGETG